MAIAAIAIVSLIGLIPSGLETIKDAGDNSIEARIHQQVLSELQLTSFRDSNNSEDLESGPLQEFHRQVRLYDAQGVELGYKNRTNSLVKGPMNDAQDIEFNWAYTARIWLPRFEPRYDVPQSLKHGEGVGKTYASPLEDTESELLTVIVETVPFQIPNGADQAELFFDDQDNIRSIDTYQTTVVRMGQNFIKE